MCSGSSAAVLIGSAGVRALQVDGAGESFVYLGLTSRAVWDKARRVEPAVFNVFVCSLQLVRARWLHVIVNIRKRPVDFFAVLLWTS